MSSSSSSPPLPSPSSSPKEQVCGQCGKGRGDMECSGACGTMLCTATGDGPVDISCGSQCDECHGRWCGACDGDSNNVPLFGECSEHAHCDAITKRNTRNRHKRVKRKEAKERSEVEGKRQRKVKAKGKTEVVQGIVKRYDTKRNGNSFMRIKDLQDLRSRLDACHARAAAITVAQIETARVVDQLHESLRLHVAATNHLAAFIRSVHGHEQSQPPATA